MSEIQPCPICGCCVLEEDKQRLADYTALLARHNALREAVAWERECEAVRNKNRMFRNWPETVEAERSYDAARAEVDRLIANETSADCKGEG